MRLNPDCIRDILLILDEEYFIPDSHGYVNQVPPRELLSNKALEKYTPNELLYTIDRLFEAQLLIKGSRYVDADRPYIKDLDPDAYTFIDSIKPVSNWEKIKAAFKQYAPSTIPAIIDLAQKILLK